MKILVRVNGNFCVLYMDVRTQENEAHIYAIILLRTYRRAIQSVIQCMIRMNVRTLHGVVVVMEEE